MAGAGGDIRAGRAYVELYANKTALVKDLKAIGAELKAWGAGITAVGKKVALAGGAVFTPMLAAAHSWAAAGSAMQDLSTRTQLSVQYLSVLKYAASQNSVEFGTIEAAIHKTNRTLTEAAEGSAGANLALARLGLTVGYLLNLRPDDRFKAVASALQQIKDPAIQDGLAMAVMGKSAAELKPLLDDLSHAEQEARQYGLIADPKSVAAAAELQHGWVLLEKVFHSVYSTIGSSLAPMLNGLLKTMAEYLVIARQWVKDNRPLVVQIFQIGAAVLGLGTALVVGGKVISILGGGFRSAAGLITGFAHAIGIATNVAGAAIGGVRSLAGVLGLTRIGSTVASAAVGAYRLSLTGLSTALSAAARGGGTVLTSSLSASRSAMMAATSAAKSLTGAALAGIGPAFSAIGRGAAGGLGLAKSGISSLYSTVSSAVQVLHTGASAIGQGISAGVQGIYMLKQGSSILGGLARAGYAAGSALRAITVGLPGTINSAMAGIKAVPRLLTAAYAGAAGLVTAAWSAAAGVVAAAWSALQAVPGLLSAAYAIAAGWASTAWSAAAALPGIAWTALTSIPSLLSAAWAAGASLATSAWAAAPAIVAAAWAALPALITAVVVGGIAVAMGFVLKRAGTVLLTGMSTLGGAVFSGMKAVLSGIGSAIAGAFSTVVEAVGRLSQTVRSFAGSVVGTVGSIFSQVVPMLGKFSGWVGSAFGSIWKNARSAFDSIFEDAKGAFSAISDALAAGDIGAAMAVALAFVNLEWVKLTNFAMDVWDSFKNYWNNSIAILEVAFVNLRAKVLTIWTDLVATIKRLWNEAQAALVHGLFSVAAKVPGSKFANTIFGGDTHEIARKQRNLESDQLLGPHKKEMDAYLEAATHLGEMQAGRELPAGVDPKQAIKEQLAKTQKMYDDLKPLFAEKHRIDTQSEEDLLKHFAAGATSSVDQDRDAANKRIEADRQKGERQTEADRKKREADILGANQGNAAGRNDRLAKAKAAENDAQKAFKDAQAKAHAVKVAFDKEEKDKQEGLPGLGDVAGLGSGKVAGTFNASVAGMMGSGSGFSMLGKKMDNYIRIGDRLVYATESMRKALAVT